MPGVKSVACERLIEPIHHDDICRHNPVVRNTQALLRMRNVFFDKRTRGSFRNSQQDASYSYFISGRVFQPC
jgi:hypothetical protein